MSRVLGEIQIQQKYSQRELKPAKDCQEAANGDLKDQNEPDDGRNPDEADGASEKLGAVDDQDP